MSEAPRHVHFVAIGGTGMGSFAGLLHARGVVVTGSDEKLYPPMSTLLEHWGIPVQQGFRAENVLEHPADLVVIGNAVRASNPEARAAIDEGLPYRSFPDALYELAIAGKHPVVVSGTHGKTTTTSLVASVLAEGGVDPTFVIGGRLTAAASNARLGAGDFIVVEADESDASFLHLLPVIAIVTNIDADHMETYEHDFARLKQAFVQFLQNLPFYGSAILCADDPHVREIMPFVSKPIVTYGLAKDAMVRAESVEPCGDQMCFRTIREGVAGALDIRLNLPGRHNVQNALAAIAVGTEIGIADAAILKALDEFHGVGRRFQRCGDVPLAPGGHFTLVDDYGHHPAEMAATLDAARGAYPGRRIVLAFQPHRYTRTRDLFEDFVRVLSTVDALALAEVYPAGEQPIVAADGRALARAVRVAGKVEPVFVEAIGGMPAAILQMAQDGDVVLTMGAGSIGGVAHRLVNREP
jgi:UDP-N-acetylmuramate--alanine ligase